jgi:hypothetical protein
MQDSKDDGRLVFASGVAEDGQSTGISTSMKLPGVAAGGNR